MALLVRAFPVTKPLEQVEEFIYELKSRRGEASAFYREHGVTHESWFLQQTPAGPWIIVVNLAEDPKGAAVKYAASTEAYQAWFKSKVLELTGIDPATQPLGPPTKLVYDWSEERQQLVAKMMQAAELA